MKIWEHKDFKLTLEKARTRTKKLGAKDDMDSIYLLEKEIEEYRSKIEDLEEQHKNNCCSCFFNVRKEHTALNKAVGILADKECVLSYDHKNECHKDDLEEPVKDCEECFRRYLLKD